MSDFKLLTDAEVAVILRMTPRGVGRLRLIGRIPFVPGRPPTILETDLLAYIEAAKLKKRDSAAAKVVDAGDKARARAQKNWRRRRFKERQLQSSTQSPKV